MLQKDLIMYAVEFQASIKDGMIQIPEEYLNLTNNHHVKLIMMYDKNDDVELEKNRATIVEQVKNYHNGTSTLLNKEESSAVMGSFMKDLKSKHANS